MRRNFIKIIAVSVAFSLCFLSACSEKKEEEPAKEESVKEDKLDIVMPTEPEGPVSLLTNEPVDEEVAKTRPLAVMIENTTAAFPHYGLSEAGIIYEITVEGGITRYMCVYDDYKDFEKLGNVRSARPYYIYIAAEYEAIFAHFGQSVEARNILDSDIVDEIDGMMGGNAYFRSSEKKAPHNAYISSEGLMEDVDNHGFDTVINEDYESHFQFAEEENLLEEGEDAGYIKLYYYANKPWFEYNSDTQTYKRYAFGDLEPDALSEEGIEVSNIIFQDVATTVADSEGHLTITLVDEGTGKFFTRGKAVDITWKKDSITDKTRYYMPDGSEIELNTGKTFVCLTDTKQKDDNIIAASKEAADN